MEVLILRDLRRESLEIISNVGSARSYYIEAIGYAKQNNFEKAYDSIKNGVEAFRKGHNIHSRLVFDEASNINDDNLNLILIHAEDLLMSAEGFKIISMEFVDLYKRLYENEII